MASKSGIIQLAADVVQHAASSVTWCYSGGCKFLKLNDVLLFQNCIPMYKYQSSRSDNLQHNTVGQRDDVMIVLPSDGPMFILIDWE